MNDLISRTELFNRLSRVPIGPYAIDERASIYNTINDMEPVLIAFLCDHGANCGGGKSCAYGDGAPIYGECFHTTDPEHAANFDKIGGAYMERMHPRAQWVPRANMENIWMCSNCEALIYSETAKDMEWGHVFCGRCGSLMSRAEPGSEGENGD